MHADSLILAEEAAAHAHGPHPAVFGVAAFVILMLLLVITSLFSGLHQEPSSNAKTVAEVERENRRGTSR
ncbi:hypothetical protein HMPREF1484_01832 [Dermabacter sp. HFH0086]|uniref:hypothetical protein n=1 Tax=Dermabacter TaxID=36739 RepID=UPI0003536D09|nr:MULTISPECIES: hypothetical protein [Dermabacter]EPH14528.1 hypothetical protein HMPREF1484_01832 [Dermabacter sp. HFH0086]